MDGFLLAEKAKELARPRRLLVIMLTSASAPEDAARCRQLNIDAYLVKPVRRSDLLNAISVVLASEHEVVGNPTADDIPLPRQNREKLRILLVEDNRVNEVVATRMLQKRGHEVTAARNGRAGLKALLKQTPDLVLMDVQMPEMDGFEATAAIRKDELKSGKHLPIIATTAHAMAGDKERCLQAGMDGYVSKPIRADDLFAVIQQVLDAAAPLP